MQILNPHKIGDTFTLIWSLPIAFGSLIATVESQIRDSNDTLIESLTVVQLASTATQASWQISATSIQTQTWALGKAFCDIKHIAIDGSVIHCDTFTVKIIKGQTE